jgi:hypothetical protein
MRCGLISIRDTLQVNNHQASYESDGLESPGLSSWLLSVVWEDYIDDNRR